ncbi:hypothetical protein LJC42_00215 [Eubacteriales bacterium OttesenSCG-928-K08]|nr:hypothetical protein [Eubacteriales bacterium OttesenSCG-928-K08]
MNLIPAIKEINRQISEECKRHNEKIIELEAALAAIRKLNTTCETCAGKKVVNKPRACAEDERDQIVCPDCHGTGRTEQELKFYEGG